MSKETRQIFNEIFLQELENLNEGQELAVNNIEGPVLVIAGPGTGKTHILSARIGKILQDTDAQPHNILCLTFTDAGVIAMRERLLEFIGPEAHKVHIFTFHSFCNHVIQENMELFGKFDMELVSDLERVEIIKGMIDDLPEENPLKKGRWDVHFHVSHLKNLFKIMKTENWSSELINNHIEKYLEDLPFRDEYIYKRKVKGYKKGDVKESKINEQEDRMAKLRAGAKLFPVYLKQMQERGRYDYEDMILWVLQEFKANEALLRRYQEQYLYFLVDEYQDTNGSQNEIIQQLIDFWENPNIFVVGDDDQAIYEFQGARLKNIMDFYQNHLPDIKLVMLKENYRSSQNILDASKSVIDNNDERIISNIEGLDKNLVASNQKVAASIVRPKIIAYPNRLHEDIAIANKIEQLYKEGFPLNEVAVIYAKHKQARNILKLLEKKRIPYNTKKRVNILDTVLIQNLRIFLEYIYAEHRHPHSGEEYLFKILHFDFIGIPPRDLARLSTYMAKHNNRSDFHWRDVITKPEILAEIGFEDIPSLTRFSDFLDTLLIDFGNLRCLSFLEKLINRSGLLHYTLKHEDKAWRLQVISTFFDFVRRETDKNPRFSVRRLIEVLKNMDDNNLAIGVNKTVSAENGVNFLTAHGSKGLEFQVVCMIDCNQDWEASGGGNRYNFLLPDTLTLSNETENQLESRRRLFYVAMTRAKEELFISFSKKDNKDKTLEKTLFIEEILEKQRDIQVESRVVPMEEVLSQQGLLLLELETPSIPELDKAKVTELLENFVMSVSAMNAYMRCPLSFQYEYVLRIPSVPNEAATYGTAMHNALRRLFDKMLAHEEKAFPDVEEFILDFASEMKRRRHYFSKSGYARRMRMGKKNLTLYYQQHIKKWSKTVMPEMDVRNVELQGVPMKGALDKVVVQGDKSVKIVDYKTGSLNDKKMKPPTKKDLEGGIYWRQLYFYKILFEQYRNQNRKVSSAEIAYLETDKDGNFPTNAMTFNDEHENLVKQMIMETYKKIKAHDFYEGCGKDTCKWCNFAKRNIMTDSFVDEEAGELDD